MLTLCWAAKGGSGTTVVSCALALLASRRERSWLVDLAGDAPAALGIAEPSGPGVHDWIASPSAARSALESIAVPVSDQLRLLPRGTAVTSPDNPRWGALGEFLVGLSAPVFVDAGTCSPGSGLTAVAANRLLVTKPCYLSLRRAAASDVAPTGVVVLHEPGRALRAHDVAYALHAPVVAEVELDPAVARAVDAGLLLARLPRTLTSSLQQLAA